LVIWQPVVGPVEILRELTVEERANLEAHHRALDYALQPFSRGEADVVRGVLSAMFNGYRSLSFHDVGEAMLTVDIALAGLAEFPAWAIKQACAGFIRAKREFAPNDNEIYVAASEAVRWHRVRLKTTKFLLDAVVDHARDARVTAVPPHPSGRLATVGGWK
jgi:hypothetical protein